MKHERALQAVLVVVGLLFMGGIYPIAGILRNRDHSGYGDAMMMSIYVALGIFLLLAARNPAANRSLIAFTVWSSFAHAFVMTIMAIRDQSARDLLGGVAAFVVIGVVLLALTPRKGPAAASASR
jgi:hypothetical protein